MHPAHDVDGRTKPPVTHPGLAGRSACKGIFGIALDGNLLRCANFQKDCEVLTQLPHQRHGQTRSQAPAPSIHTKPALPEALARLQDEAPTTSGSAGKQFRSNLFPRNSRGRIGTVRRQASMQLSLLILRQPNGIGRFHSNTVPDVLDELDTLRDGQLHVFGGGGCRHVRSIKQG